MREAEFDTYLRSCDLADKTRQLRGYALKRIEKAHDVDLDTEFDRDGMESLLRRLSYSAADARAGLANPSKLDIDGDKLKSHLAWYRSHAMSYLRFRGGVAPVVAADVIEDATTITEELLEEAVGWTFRLEKDLQTALRLALADLEPGLKIIDGGVERRVEAGFIDITARDASGVLTVIELKADIARPEAVAQILAYMGCLAEETGEAVRGILVAADHHARVVHAAKAIGNLSLKRYRFRFGFD